jgi:cation diffusion facilitator CzcD-associated flavoprotein CzcO
MSNPDTSISTQETTPTFDVIIIGAGISGINSAYRLQERLPNLSYTILEDRQHLGGTWDFFKYPGLRSDSDLYSFGFPWQPWTAKESIAQGDVILQYLRDAAAKFGIDGKVRFGHRVESADWRSGVNEWRLSVKSGEKTQEYRSRFLIFGTGYYDYHTPLQTEIPGISEFKGPVVHTQFWPKSLDYKDKTIVIIGSGATAVTLFPALAQTGAKHVTMLQRSPSYILSQPREDGIERFIRRWSPASWISTIIRYKWLAMPWLFNNFCHYFPNLARTLLLKATKMQLPKTQPIDPDFLPTYKPWDQRMCFCPDGDFYKTLRKGNGSVITGQISTITEQTIKLNDGRELNPDIIVTATGLKMQIAGGMALSVDGTPLNPAGKFIWKNIMLQDLPNSFYMIGYVNASWTLGADASAQLLCRMIKKMEREKTEVVVAKVEEGKVMKRSPYLGLSSTYIRAANDVLPVAGDEPQWRGRTSYFKDIWEAWFGDISTGVVYT